MSVNVGVLDAILALRDDFTPTLNKAVSNLHTKAGQAEAAGKKVAAVGGSFDQLGRAVSAMKGMLAGAGIGLLVNELIGAQTQLDRLNNGMLAATGSTVAATKELAFVTETADRLGLSMQNVAQSYTIFTAAAKGTAVEGQVARDIFTATAEAATALGLSAEQTSGALTAFQQMVSKGTVQAEELRGQLAERIPGAFNLAAKAMGVSTMRLGEMLVEGKVLAKDLLPKLAEEMHKTFGPGVLAGSQSLQAEINRIQTKIFEFFTTVSKGLDLSSITRSISELVTVLAELATSGMVVAWLTDVGNAARDSLGIVGDLFNMLNAVASIGGKKVGGLGISLSDITPIHAIAATLGNVREGLDDNIKRFLAWRMEVAKDSAAAGQHVMTFGSLFASTAIGITQSISDINDAFVGPIFDQKAWNQDRVDAFRKTLAHLTKAWVDGEPAAKEYESALKSFQDRLKKAATQEKFAKMSADKLAEAHLEGAEAVAAAERELAILTKMEDFAIDPILAGNAAIKAQVEALRKLVEQAYDATKAQEDLADAQKKSSDEYIAMNAAIATAWEDWDKEKEEAAKSVKDALDDLKFEVEWQGKYEEALRGGADALREYAIARNMAEFERDNPTATDADLEQALAYFTELENRIAKSTAMDEWMKQAEGVADVFGAMDSQLGDIGSAAVGIAISFKKMGDEAASSADRFGALASMVTGVVGLLKESGLIAGPGGGTSQFGGAMSGTYSAEGAVVGAVIGAILGTMAYGNTAAGAAIGSAIGEVMGSMINKGADEGLVAIRNTGVSASQRFHVGITGVNNKLARNLSDAATQMIENVQDIISTLGGELMSIANIDFKVRDDKISVFVNGIKKQFKEMDEAMSFAMTELLRTAETLNMDELFKAVLSNSSAQDMDALKADLEAIAEVISFGLTDSQNTIRAFQSELAALSNTLMRNVTDVDQLARGLANLGAEEARRWQSSRDAITGEQRSNAEKLAMLKQDAEMWNAEKAMRVADLNLKALEAQQKIDRFKADIALAKAGGILWNSKFESDKAKIEAEKRLIYAQNDIHQAALDGHAAYLEAQMALLQVQLDAINKLSTVLANMPDIDVPNLNLPNIGGGGHVGVSGPSDEELAAEEAARVLADLFKQLELDLGHVYRAGNEWSTALYDLQLRIEEMRVAAAGNAEALAQINELLELEMYWLFADAVDALGLASEATRDEFTELSHTLNFLKKNGKLTEAMMRELSETMFLSLADGLMQYVENEDTRMFLEDLRFRMEMANYRLQYEMMKNILKLTAAEIAIIDGLFAQIDAAYLAGTLDFQLPRFTQEPDDQGGGSSQDSQVNQNLLDAIDRLRNSLEEYNDFLAGLHTTDLGGDTLQQQTDATMAQFLETLALAQAGNLDAIELLPSLAENLLGLAGDLYDPASAGYQGIVDMIEMAMRGIGINLEDALSHVPASMDDAVNELQTIAEILEAIAAGGLNGGGGGNQNQNGNGNGNNNQNNQQNFGSAELWSLFGTLGTFSAAQQAEMESRIARYLRDGEITTDEMARIMAQLQEDFGLSNDQITAQFQAILDLLNASVPLNGGNRASQQPFNTVIPSAPSVRGFDTIGSPRVSGNRNSVVQMMSPQLDEMNQRLQAIERRLNTQNDLTQDQTLTLKKEINRSGVSFSNQRGYTGPIRGGGQ